MKENEALPMSRTESSDDLSEANREMGLEIAQLKLKFEDILSRRNKRYTFHLQNPQFSSSSVSDSTGYDDIIDSDTACSRREIGRLRVIAGKLNSIGEIRVCSMAFVDHRKDFMTRVSQRAKKKLKTVHCSEGEEFHVKMNQWIQVTRVCVSRLFADEKAICDKIFGNYDKSTGDECFVNITGDAVTKLLDFVDSLVLDVPRLPGRLNIILPLYVSLVHLMKDFNYVFQAESAANVRSRAAKMMSRFHQHMARVMSDSEHHVLGELSDIPTPRGKIHPLTTYVVNYISLLAKQKDSLADLVIVAPNVKGPVISSTEAGGRDLSSHFIRILEFLLYKLNSKTKCYKDAPSRHFFMLSNLHF